jgi:hypothetical protein
MLANKLTRTGLRFRREGRHAGAKPTARACSEAHLDGGAMWPVAFALKELSAAEEKRIAALVKQAVS